MLTPRSLSFYGRYSFARQLPSELLAGIGLEMTYLGPFILAKMFQPSGAAIAALFSIQHIIFMMAPWLTEKLRGIRTHTAFAGLAVAAALSFGSGAFVANYWTLGAIIVSANLIFVTLVVPLKNRLYRANFEREERGRCYGRFRTLCNLVFFGFAYWFAIELETNSASIHWVFPIIGVLTALGLWSYRRVRIRGEAQRIRQEKLRRHNNFFQTYRAIGQTLRDNLPFRRFEIGFMIYGVAFMISIPQEIAAATGVINLSYADLVIGLYAVTPLAKMAAFHSFGKCLDRYGPTFTSGVSFAALITYALTLWFAINTGSPLLWFTARAFFGVAIAGIDITWSIGPVAFGGRNQAGAYSSTHIFLVGFRALFGPALGAVLFLSYGNNVHLISACLLGLAAVYAMRSPAQDPQTLSQQ